MRCMTNDIECTVAQYEAMERLITSDCPETDFLETIIAHIDDPRTEDTVTA